jgi:hypothetical protein
MVRVTRPGGWMVVLDTDWGTLSADTALVDVERRLMRHWAEHGQHNGFAGRTLYRLFKQQVLAEVAVEARTFVNTSYQVARTAGHFDRAGAMAVAAGALTADELAALREEWERADAAGTFFGTVSLLLVAGRKG